MYCLYLYCVCFVLFVPALHQISKICSRLLQLGIHSIPIGLLNVRGYYDHLLAHLNHARGEGFLAPDHHDLLLVEKDVDRLLDQMANVHARSTLGKRM